MIAALVRPLAASTSPPDDERSQLAGSDRCTLLAAPARSGAVALAVDAATPADDDDDDDDDDDETAATTAPVGLVAVPASACETRDGASAVTELDVESRNID